MWSTMAYRQKRLYKIESSIEWKIALIVGIPYQHVSFIIVCPLHTLKFLPGGLMITLDSHQNYSDLLGFKYSNLQSP